MNHTEQKPRKVPPKLVISNTTKKGNTYLKNIGIELSGHVDNEETSGWVVRVKMRGDEGKGKGREPSHTYTHKGMTSS